MWHGPLFVSSRRDLDAVVLKHDVEFVSSYVYNEREVLIDALENWLMNLQETPCNDPFCWCESEPRHTV